MLHAQSSRHSWIYRHAYVNTHYLSFHFEGFPCKLSVLFVPQTENEKTHIRLQTLHNGIEWKLFYFEPSKTLTPPNCIASLCDQADRRLFVTVTRVNHRPLQQLLPKIEKHYSTRARPHNYSVWGLPTLQKDYSSWWMQLYVSYIIS